MPLQKKLPGSAAQRHDSWSSGRGRNSMRGELKRGIALRKKQLNRRVRHHKMESMQYSEYKHLSPTILMVDFS